MAGWRRSTVRVRKLDHYCASLDRSRGIERASISWEFRRQANSSNEDEVFPHTVSSLDFSEGRAEGEVAVLDGLFRERHSAVEGNPSYRLPRLSTPAQSYICHRLSPAFRTNLIAQSTRFTLHRVFDSHYTFRFILHRNRISCRVSSLPRGSVSSSWLKPRSPHLGTNESRPTPTRVLAK